jgi:catechol 2,3-dioxygenase-like lactoylglutathione lyase family enzyme
MLSTNPLIAFIPSKDTSRSRSFYEGALGLLFVCDDPFAVVMDSNGIKVRIVLVGEFAPAPFTILGWEVNDINASVAELSGKGVQFNRYPYFEQSQDGVWTAPNGAKVAWFSDPDGNVLSVSQHEVC